MFDRAKKKLRFSAIDIKAIFRKKQTQIEANANDIFFERASGTGVVTETYIKSTIRKLLAGTSVTDNSEIYRISIADIATILDLDKQTTVKYAKEIYEELGSDIYYMSETYLTKNELLRIQKALIAVIDESSYIDSLTFGISEKIDPVLVERITTKINSTEPESAILTIDNPTTGNSEHLLISKTRFDSASEKLYEYLNTLETPTSLSELSFPDSDDLAGKLLADSQILPALIKTVPQAIKDEKVKGKLLTAISEDNKFVPRIYTLKLQKQNIDILKANGVIANSEFTKTDVSNIDEYLKQNLDSSDYVLLSENIVLPFYYEKIASDIVNSIKLTGFSDIGAVLFVGLTSNTTDRETLLQQYVLPKVKVDLDGTAVQNIFLTEPVKTKKGNTSEEPIPAFIVTTEFYQGTKSQLETNFAQAAADSESKRIVNNDEILTELTYSYQNKLNDNISAKDFASAILEKAESGVVNDKKINNFLLKTKAPSALMLHFGTQFLAETKTHYEAALLSATEKFVQEEYLSKWYPVLLYANAIIDIVNYDTKMGKAFFADLSNQLVQENLVLTADDAALSTAITKMKTTPENVKHLIEAKIKSIDSGLTDADILKHISETRARLLETLGHLMLQSRADADIAAFLFYASVTVYDNWLLADSNSAVVGALNINPSLGTKLVKMLDDRFEISELIAVRDLLKEKKEVPEEVLDAAVAFASSDLEKTPLKLKSKEVPEAAAVVSKEVIDEKKDEPTESKKEEITEPVSESVTEASNLNEEKAPEPVVEKKQEEISDLKKEAEIVSEEKEEAKELKVEETTEPISEKKEEASESEEEKISESISEEKEEVSILKEKVSEPVSEKKQEEAPELKVAEVVSEKKEEASEPKEEEVTEPLSEKKQEVSTSKEEASEPVSEPKEEKEIVSEKKDEATESKEEASEPKEETISEPISEEKEETSTLKEEVPESVSEKKQDEASELKEAEIVAEKKEETIEPKDEEVTESTSDKKEEVSESKEALSESISEEKEEVSTPKDEAPEPVSEKKQEEASELKETEIVSDKKEEASELKEKEVIEPISEKKEEASDTKEETTVESISEETQAVSIPKEEVSEPVSKPDAEEKEANELITLKEEKTEAPIADEKATESDSKADEEQPLSGTTSISAEEENKADETSEKSSADIKQLEESTVPPATTTSSPTPTTETSTDEVASETAPSENESSKAEEAEKAEDKAEADKDDEDSVEDKTSETTSSNNTPKKKKNNKKGGNKKGRSKRR